MTNQDVLTSAKRKLPLVLDQFDRGNRCIYVDYPVHTNVGDLLINLGTESFFSAHQVDIWRRYSILDFPTRIRQMDTKVVFLLHGGGNLGDLWPEHQVLREHILERYPRNRIIFLPQSVYYCSDETERRGMAIMARHGNLHIYVRDLDSLDRLQRRGVRSVSTMPDMAHWLCGSLKNDQEEDEKRSVMLFRRDKEASGIPQRFIREVDASVDWNDVFSFSHKIIWHSVFEIIRRGGRLGAPLRLDHLWYRSRDTLIRDSVNFLSRYGTFITNRLHAVILGLLLNKRVVWFDNSYGKLASYVGCWLSASPKLTAALSDENLFVRL